MTEPAPASADAPAPTTPPAPAKQAAPAAASTQGSVVRGCTLAAERVLQEQAELTWLTADRGELAVLVLHQEKKLALYRGSSLAALVPAGSAELPTGLSRASLTAADTGARLAWVDSAGHVQLATLEPSGLGKPRVIAEGADRRFAPALAHAEGVTLVAFVRAVGEAMHTFVARLAGDTLSLRDITPPGHGAAAPAFVLGSERPSLVMIDAHAGVSPLLELAFTADGQAREVSVRTPVSQPYAPPLLQAVELPSGEVQVAYTAVGKLAATAIGRVPLRQSQEPVALLPSRGYGELRFAAARGPERAAFAYEVPRSEAAKATRSLELVLLDQEGTGPVLTLAAEGPEARAPSLAIHAGALWLSYTRGAQAVVSSLRCDLD